MTEPKKPEPEGQALAAHAVFDAKPSDAPRFSYSAKLGELKRELALRRNVYPGLVQRGKLKPEQAEQQTALLEAVVTDYAIQPWPQTLSMVKEWRPKVEGLTVLGVPANRLHREELLAVLAFSVEVLRRAGLLTKPEEGKPHDDAP